jgi:Rrf2 family protein
MFGPTALRRHAESHVLCVLLPGERQGMCAGVLSQKTRYAIRAMQHLADCYGRGAVQLSEIAERQKIPAKFLTVILSELSRFGIVHSQRGKDGGYWLAIPPIDITYGDLIRVMRGSLALVPCASRFAHEKCKNCVEEGDCRTRALMLQVRDRTAELLDSIRLSDPISPVPPFSDDQAEEEDVA